MKSLRDGTVDPAALAMTPIGEDLVALKAGEALAREFGHERKVFSAVSAGGATCSTICFPDQYDKLLSTISAPVGADLPPSEDGSTPPAPAVAPGKETPDMERTLKALDLASTATDEEAADAIEQVKAASEQAKADAEKFRPMAVIGEQALQDQAKRYVDAAIKLGQPETEAKAVAELFIQRRDYAGLRDLADAKEAQVCERFPLGTAADHSVTQNGQTAVSTAASIRRHGV
jgi:hypothetical protein